MEMKIDALPTGVNECHQYTFSFVVAFPDTDRTADYNFTVDAMTYEEARDNLRTILASICDAIPEVKP